MRGVCNVPRGSRSGDTTTDAALWRCCSTDALPPASDDVSLSVFQPIADAMFAFAIDDTGRGGEPRGFGTAAATVFNNAPLSTGIEMQPSIPVCSRRENKTPPQDR